MAWDQAGITLIVGASFVFAYIGHNFLNHTFNSDKKSFFWGILATIFLFGSLFLLMTGFAFNDLQIDSQNPTLETNLLGTSAAGMKLISYTIYACLGLCFIMLIWYLFANHLIPLIKGFPRP